MNELIHKEITNSVIGGFFEVYNELGNGFLESVYEKALSIVLTENGLSVERQKDIPVYFRSHLVGDFKADLVRMSRVSRSRGTRFPRQASSRLLFRFVIVLKI